ncbi:MAG: type I-E CRISPR-associated protein Cse1/CasA [Desulfobacteraceae bacterium]|nr:type I-E CRISPR-associated protein Cse1/CasA [Desulfobacteraceae bacterium]
MEAHSERRFNLVDEGWIAVAGQGLVGLRRIFADDSLRALGGNPVQKIALIKLLLAIAQAAWTPENDNEWARYSAAGMAQKTLRYLEEKKDLFWLYGDKPFLQMPAISKAKSQTLGALLPEVATGNTTILFQSQIEGVFSEVDKALLLVLITGFALGGKKTDNSIVLSSDYTGKTNEKGRPSASKSGPSLGYLGYLHNFLNGKSLLETIWLNLITQKHIEELPQFEAGLGVAPWESMPEGECCPVAEKLKKSLMGRLVPLCRFVYLSSQDIHYSEGIIHPTHKDGGFDPTIAVDFSKSPKALWADPGKRPWRELTSLLSFFDATGNRSYECPQLRIGFPRARTVVPEFGVWSGGLRVSSNAGEQYVSGADDFVESEVRFASQWLGDIWFAHLKTEMGLIENVSKVVYASASAYFKQQKSDGKNHAAAACNLFWQLSEKQFQNLVNACGDTSGKQAQEMRRHFVNFGHTAYNAYCPRDTARQIEAWAAHRPNLGRVLSNPSENQNDKRSTQKRRK